jgi:hypothetical protein
MPISRLRPFLVCALLLSSVAAGTIAVPYQNVRINQTANYPEETSITVNPHDPANIVAAAQGSGCYFYSSYDSGLTWTQGTLPGPYTLGDPSVIFDRLGNVYYCYIGTFSHSGIFVNRSVDGGRSWRPAGIPVIEHNGAVPFEDKSYPVADWTTGAYAGNVYVSWSQFTHYGSSDPADSSFVLFSRSTDRCDTFSAPIRISDHAGDAIDSDNTVEGAVPAVGPDGTVYVAWAGPRGLEIDRSTDGGVTFGQDKIISDLPGGWDFPVPGIYRANGLPITKVDLSYGPHRGRLYINWGDQRNGDTDIFLIYSDDGGRTWSPRVRVNDDPLVNGRDQFFSWLDVDPVTGSVYVVFYDRREHSDNLTTDVYLAYSDDGGAHFVNEKVSATAFLPRSDIFFGDYTGISAFAGSVRPFWMRLDGSTLSVWTALVDRASASVPESRAGMGSLTIRFNPVRQAGAQILYSAGPSDPTAARLEIHDVSGRLMAVLAGRNGDFTLWDGRDAAGNDVPAGVYFVSCEGLAPARIVLVR